MTRITKDSAQYSDLETKSQFLDILPIFSLKKHEDFDMYFEEKSIAITTAMKNANLRADRHRNIIDGMIKEKSECFEIRRVTNTNAQKLILTAKGDEYKNSLKTDLEYMKKILAKHKKI